MKNSKGPGNFFAKSCDITKESDVIQAFKWIEQKFNTVHILINNSGTLKTASFEGDEYCFTYFYFYNYNTNAYPNLFKQFRSKN